MPRPPCCNKPPWSCSGRRGRSPTGNLASRVGLDEIGFKGAAPGEDANTAALTLGKRISKDLYLTYERTLSGTLGALYIFYDLSRTSPCAARRAATARWI